MAPSELTVHPEMNGRYRRRSARKSISCEAYFGTSTKFLSIPQHLEEEVCVMEAYRVFFYKIIILMHFSSCICEFKNIVV